MADKNKIAYIIDDLSIGGAQKQLFLLLKILPENFIPIVCCLSELKDPFGAAMVKLGVKVYYMRRRSHFEVRRLLEIARILKKEKSGIVHSFLYASNAYSFLCARLLKIPVVLSLRSDRVRLGRLRNFILGYMFRWADATTVNSRAGLSYLIDEKRVDRKRVCLVRNCRIDSKESATSASLNVHKKIIGYVGRIPSRGKNLENLIKAFAILASDDTQCTLEIVGDGEGRRKLEELSRLTGQGDRIKFHGALWNVEAVMKNFTCLVLSSDFEGLPNVIIEALSLGIPVVASRVGDVPDIVMEGKTGRIMNDNSVQTLSRILSEVLADDKLQSSARRLGPDTIKSRFSAEKTLSTLIPLYEQLSANRKKR